ncbi:hypothetical protein M378DRAFT_567581 [Amanita muscaria Koide BX008]|uniref:Uncharacterized protein n=1 Tax=Amanita muscaria (strain Koide BX008) TaxID=946122 RepID=A0A0C2WT48_AMAMK|nr:hypothetical protein M378DRAFT_567581 [Amanita muscaria Koide BX008]
MMGHSRTGELGLIQFFSGNRYRCNESLTHASAVHSLITGAPFSMDLKVEGHVGSRIPRPKGLATQNETRRPVSDHCQCQPSLLLPTLCISTIEDRTKQDLGTQVDSSGAVKNDFMHPLLVLRESLDCVFG